MLISPRDLKSLKSIEKMQRKMIVATFTGKLSTISICYSPINTSDETDIITFFNEPTSISVAIQNTKFKSSFEI